MPLLTDQDLQRYTIFLQPPVECAETCNLALKLQNITFGKESKGKVRSGTW